ncbi:MAG: TM2 domain-containing protein [Bacillota bacterium]
MSKKKDKREFRMEVGDNGEMIKVYLEPEVVPEQTPANPEGEKLSFLTVIKNTNFPEKSQFTAIVVSVFLGAFCVHDFYLGMKKRAIGKYIFFAISIIPAAILFAQVQNEAIISYNTLYQALMMLPLLMYFLLWSYDFITIASKKSTHFKQKPIKVSTKEKKSK